MSEAIITVEGLGKRYRLGASRSNERYTALRDVVAEAAMKPFRALNARFGRRNSEVSNDPQSRVRNPQSVGSEFRRQSRDSTFNSTRACGSVSDARNS